MGIFISGASKVVTVTSVGRAVLIQPGNRKWVTIIECINGLGEIIPPFLILDGKVHLEAWHNQEIPHNWTIAVSDNGWTTEALGLEWIQHFNRWTQSRTIGTHRLLILNGHGSHVTPEFDQYYSQHNIITLCMPSHSSHILQPLDAACFSALKSTYSKLVQHQIRNGIFHLDKADFLRTYAQARSTIQSKKTILSGFRATGLIPFNPERVISSLILTKTPSPPSSSHGQASSP